MNYSFSTSYDKEKGYLKGNDNQRVMLNLTTSAKLTKNLTFDVSLNTVFTKKENNGTSVSELKTYISPWTRLVDDNGEYTHVSTLPKILYRKYLSTFGKKDGNYPPAHPYVIFCISPFVIYP